jgi:FkbH-like protein
MLDFYSCSINDILMKRKSLRNQLSAVPGLQELRVAVLGGTTTNEVVNLFELLLLADGFKPVFHQSEYGRFYEDAVHDTQALADFKPNVIYIHTSCLNVQNAPPLGCTEADLPGYVEAELSRYTEMWDSLESKVGCQIIQNNFETPPYAVLGNMDAVSAGGQSRFLMHLNLAFAHEASRRPRLLLQDVHGISAHLGTRNWFNWDRYFSYKILLTAEANLELARSLNSLVRATYGKSRKVLVLDLDNTIWGGVIGDDGADKIQIGRETPVAEAYTAFQEYCLSLRNRGVLLAVCSKNTESVAKTGFAHPSAVLKLEHISCFKANWDPKHENIHEIARELNLGVDSFVFVDDNPAEREIVRAQVPGVAVPEIGNQVSKFAEIIEQGRYFEPVSLSKEDLERAALYAHNSQRAAQQNKFANYGEYLDSLEMVAEIDAFKSVYLDRIAQLTNKTNQFNLTTKRYSLADMEGAVSDSSVIGLYGKLADKFGDNGLISIVLGRKDDSALHMDLWLMSCRVLKRDMEVAMLDAVVDRAREQGIQAIYGYFFPTAKNAMVAEFYPTLGFQPHDSIRTDLPEGATVWRLNVLDHTERNKHIKVTEFTNG